MFRALAKGAMQLVFPRNCALCNTLILNKPTEYAVCNPCLSRLEIAPPVSALSLPLLDGYHSAYRYNQLMQHLIHRLKYHNKTGLRQCCAQLMAETLRYNGINLSHFDYLMPIALHPTRLRERGFNQSLLLAQHLSLIFSIPLQDGLIRTKPTHIQASLGRKERWTNLQGAFRMKPHLSVERSSVLLVDDLLTTGATASTAAACLKASGAATVHLITLAVA